MSDLPETISIYEEGPREGFQIESGDIATADKVRLINALGATGVASVQVCSFVSPRLVPGWADAEQVVADFTAQSGVSYTALWFNQKGLARALEHRQKLSLSGAIHVSASDAFSKSNLNRSSEENLVAMQKQTQAHLDAGLPVNKVSVMAAFGCNFAGDADPANTVAAIKGALQVADEADCKIDELALADTMGWSNPGLIERVIAAVRNEWPDKSIRLHLHDTRGLGIANAYAGLKLGVQHFDSTVGGLGGCPFAKHEGAPGNIATEELVLLAEESGVATGIDLDALIEVGHLAEEIVGRKLPSAVLRGGSLDSFRTSSHT